MDGFRASAGPVVASAVTKFIRGADAAIGVSREMSKDLARQRGGNRGIYTIGNSAHEAETAADRVNKTSRRESNAPPYIAFAARFVPEKGIADLFNAMALLKDEGCLVHLRLAGTGDSRAWTKMIEDLGIGDRVTFVGWLSGAEKLEFYRDALVFCLPSHRESFGIVTLEAMFSGVAVIGIRTGGFFDLVEEGVTGYLVEPRAPEALASSIKTLVENPDRARKMGLAGLERARRLYSTGTIVSQYIQCYRDVAVKKRGQQCA